MVKSLSIIIPAYNEEGNIASAIEEILDIVPSFVEDLEVIVVDDGSHDRTPEIVQTFEKSGVVRLRRHKSNMGKGSALATGFAVAQKDWLLMVDADRQIPIRELERFILATDDANMVIGNRISRGDPIWRRLLSKAYAFLIMMVLHLRLKDLNCPFKLFKRELLRDIRLNSKGFLIDVELILKIMRGNKTLRLKEVNLSSRPRHGGKSTVRFHHLVEVLKEIFRLRRSLKN